MDPIAPLQRNQAVVIVGEDADGGLRPYSWSPGGTIGVRSVGDDGQSIAPVPVIDDVEGGIAQSPQPAAVVYVGNPWAYPVKSETRPAQDLLLTAVPPGNCPSTCVRIVPTGQLTALQSLSVVLADDQPAIGAEQGVGATQPARAWAVRGVNADLSGFVTIASEDTLASVNAKMTDGTQKSIVSGGAKGATTAADVTSTAMGADHQALDVALHVSGKSAACLEWDRSEALESMSTSRSGAGTVFEVVAYNTAAQPHFIWFCDQVGGTSPTGPVILRLAVPAKAGLQPGAASLDTRGMPFLNGLTWFDSTDLVTFAAPGSPYAMAFIGTKGA